MRFPGPQAELSCAHSFQAHVKFEAAQGLFCRLVLTGSVLC